MLTAQDVRHDVVPLKNWATPLYWQPNQAERRALTPPRPQIQLSTNQVSNTPLTFVAITPCRVVDTRGSAYGFTGNAPFSGPSLASGGAVTFPIQISSEALVSPCGTIPSIVQAYSFNITVLPHSGAVGFLTVWPAGSSFPNASTLNDPQGVNLANAAIVPAGTSGSIDIFASNATDVFFDINGYFAP